MGKGGGFTASSPEWEIIESSYYGLGEGAVQESFRGSPRTVDMLCKDCGHEWTAHRSEQHGSPGSFQHTFGSLEVKCPNPECGQRGSIPTSELLQS